MINKVILFLNKEINKSSFENEIEVNFKQMLSESKVEYLKCCSWEELNVFLKTSEDKKTAVLITDENFNICKQNVGISVDSNKLSDINLCSEICTVGYGRNYSGNADYIIESLDGIDMKYLGMVYARYNNIPAYITETERLYIREMSLKDLDAMYELYDTLSECEFVEPLYERAKEEEFTKNYIDNMYRFFQYGLWLVFRKSDDRLIGRIGIENREIDGETRQEIGYLIGSPWQNKGYGHEACQAVIDYAAEYIGIEELFLCTLKTNKKSIHFGKSLGFEHYAEVQKGTMEGHIILKKCLAGTEVI